jgi:hypothetical protein
MTSFFVNPPANSISPVGIGLFSSAVKLDSRNGEDGAMAAESPTGLDDRAAVGTDRDEH